MERKTPPSKVTSTDWNIFIRQCQDSGQVVDMRAVNFHGLMSHPHGVELRHGGGLEVPGYWFDSCDFSTSRIQQIRFDECSFKKANFSQAVILRCEFIRCTFEDVGFFHADISSSMFSQCAFTECSLTDVRVDRETSFDKTRFIDTSITVGILEDLGPDKGELIVGQLRDLVIIDPVADLRKSFSGFQSAVYLALGIIAFFPYIWFTVSQISLITVGHSLPATSQSSPIYLNLTRFIWSGGHNWTHWQFSPWSFFAFSYSTVFNLMRLALLWETKYLEHLQSISGFTPRFDPRSWWAWLFKVHNVMKYGVIIVVLLHTLLFLSTRVPITP